MQDTALSILIVEDDEFARRGLRLFLEQRGMSVVEATNVQDALRMAADCPRDVVVVDLVVPVAPGAQRDHDGRAGLEVVRQLKARDPQQPIVILSAHRDQGTILMEMAQRKRWRGLVYLLKGERAAELERAIRLARQGGVHIAPSINLEARSSSCQCIVETLEAWEREVIFEALCYLQGLTPREFEVLLQIAASLGPRQAAAALNISIKTWHNHRHSICDKLGLNGNQSNDLCKDVLLAKIALIHRLEGGPHEAAAL